MAAVPAGAVADGITQPMPTPQPQSNPLPDGSVLTGQGAGALGVDMTQGYQADASELAAILGTVQGAVVNPMDAAALAADMGSRQMQQAQPPAVQEPTPPVVNPPQQPVQQTQEPAAPVPPVVEEVPNKVRTRTNGDPVTATALTIFNDRAASNNPVSLTEAESLARQVLGLGAATTVAVPVTAPAPAASPAPAPTPAPVVPSSVAEIDAQLATLASELVQTQNPLSDQYSPEAAAALIQKQSDLATQKALALIKAEQQQVSQTQYMADWQTSMAQAVEQFPQVADANSTLAMLAGAMQEAANNPAHPDHAAAQKGSAALYFTQKAAAALQLAPKGQPTASPVVQTTVTTSTPNAPALPHSAPPLAALLGGGATPPATASPAANLLENLPVNSAEFWNSAAYAYANGGQ